MAATCPVRSPSVCVEMKEGQQFRTGHVDEDFHRAYVSVLLVQEDLYPGRRQCSRIVLLAARVFYPTLIAFAYVFYSR